MSYERDDVAAREAALAYHDSIGLGCGWRGYRKPCPCCDAYMAGWLGRGMPEDIVGIEAYRFAYRSGRENWVWRSAEALRTPAPDTDAFEAAINALVSAAYDTGVAAATTDGAADAAFIARAPIAELRAMHAAAIARAERAEAELRRRP